MALSNNLLARYGADSIYGSEIPLTGFQTVAAIYLQAIGKPAKSALLSLSRQIIFFVPAAVILPVFMGVKGVLRTGPVADGLAFVLTLALVVYERKQLKKVPLSE